MEVCVEEAKHEAQGGERIETKYEVHGQTDNPRSTQAPGLPFSTLYRCGWPPAYSLSARPARSLLISPPPGMDGVTKEPVAWCH